MSWWTVPLIVLAAPALLLALAGWALRAAFRRVCAAVAPRPIESEGDTLSVPDARGSVQVNRVFARRARSPIAAGGASDRWSLN